MPADTFHPDEVEELRRRVASLLALLLSKTAPKRGVVAGLLAECAALVAGNTPPDSEPEP